MSESRVVHGMPMVEYQAVKALSASVLHTFVEECPAKAWQQSPWNPNLVSETKKEFDIGTALHLAVLQPERFDDWSVIIDAPDYKTKAAREQRDVARAAAATPLLRKEADFVVGMRRAIEARPDVAQLFRGGEAEVSLFWEWDGVPCKCRPDYRRIGQMVDLKSAVSANPRVVARKAFLEGWQMRAMWYMAGDAECRGTLDDSRYLYVVVEKDPPHLIQVYELDERALAWGRQQITRGLRRFKECLVNANWPGYGQGIMPLSLPVWGEHQLADEEAAAADV